MAEFIDDFRKTFLQAYDDLQKLSDSTIKYLDEREENQRVVRNFGILEPMIANKSDYVVRTLDNMERQQDEIERAIHMMEKRLGEGNYVHELSRHLEEYEIMKEEVVKLQEDAGSATWNDPSNEQLANIFENLNQV